MKFLRILLLILFPICLNAQDLIFTWIGNDTSIVAKANYNFYKLLNDNINAYDKWDKEDAITIPVEFQLTHGNNYYLYGNYIVGYTYNEKKDKVGIILW